MVVSLEVYRAAIGIFNFRVLRTAKTNLLNLLLVMLGKYLTIILCYLIVLILLFLSGDIETIPGPPQNLTLNVGHIKAKSLNNEGKYDEICSIIYDLNLDICSATETWLNSSIPSDSLNIQCFSTIIRPDRQGNRRAGGIALYLSSDIAFTRRTDLENFELELLFVEFKIRNINFFAEFVIDHLIIQFT
jgi:hypothetical protein